MKKGLFVFCFVVISLLFFVPGVMAQGGKIHFGKLKVIPSLTVQAVYDDNIYLNNSTIGRVEDDWITHIKPGLGFDYRFPGERGGVSLGFMGDLAYYNDNDDNDWQTYNVLFGLNYNAPGGLILGINNIYTDAEDPYGSDNEYNLGVPNTKRWINDLETEIGYDFSNRFKVFGFYNFYTQQYDLRKDQTQDYNSNEAGAGFQMKLLPKTWGFIRYHFGKRDYNSHPPGTGLTNANDADYDWHRANMGLTWDSGAKFSGEINFGYQWMDYDNRLDPNGNRYEDKDTWIASTAVNFDATPTTRLSLTLSRDIRPSGANTYEYYEDTSVGLNLRQKFLRKFTFRLGGSYGKNDYNDPVPKKKKQDNYLFDTGLDYQIQDWLTAGIGYSYMKKDSNYRQDEFKDNMFIMSVSLIY